MLEHLLQQTYSTCYSTCSSTAAVATGQQRYRELLKDPRGRRFSLYVHVDPQIQIDQLRNARGAHRLDLEI